MRGSLALRFPLSLPRYRSQQRTSERASKFRKSREIYSETGLPVLSQESKCSLTIFAASICEVISFWTFGSSRSPPFQSVSFFFFSSSATPHSLTGGDRVIYPAFKIERSSSGFLVNRHCYVTQRKLPL